MQITVGFPLESEYQRMEKIVTVDKTKRFMANPPEPSVDYKNLSAIQRWAVQMGVSGKQQIMYLCGKAGSGKTEIALHICKRMKVQ